MPFLDIFSQRRRPNNPVVKIRIKPVIPSMSAKWYLVNSCRPTIARNITIPAPVVLLELDITYLGCPFMTSLFCLHHVPYSLWRRYHTWNPILTGVGDLEPVTRTNSLLIPSIALGYVPFVIIVLMFYSYSSSDETLPGFEFLIFSSMCLVPLLPIYALYLYKIIRQRRENNTLTTLVVIFYIISFLVPLFWLLMYAWFAINFNGIV